MQCFIVQVTYQLKLLTTALFSVLILRMQLSIYQWFSLVVLFVGIAVVQVQPQKTASSTVNNTVSAGVPEQNVALGLAMVLAACVMSGFASVYFEKLLKHTAPSIYLRNIQLGVIGFVFGLIAAFYNDGQQVRHSVLSQHLLFLLSSLSPHADSMPLIYRLLFFSCGSVVQL